MRYRIALLAALITLLCVSSAVGAGVIEVYSNYGALQGLQVRPTRIIIGADGNGTVTGLKKWRRWGAATTTASGIQHQDNCMPSCAQGHISTYRVTVTLFDPGDYRGRYIYQCMSVSNPAPKFDRDLCVP